MSTKNATGGAGRNVTQVKQGAAQPARLDTPVFKKVLRSFDSGMIEEMKSVVDAEHARRFKTKKRAKLAA